MRFLCISDIHGDADALRAVLREGDARGYQQLIVCGDLLFPGEKALETWKLLLERKALCVQGLSDYALATVDPSSLEAKTKDQESRLARLFALHTELGDLIVARLGKLAPIARLPLENGLEMVIVHGAPADPTEAMCFDMEDEELNALIGDDPADIIVCGASHVPFDRVVSEVRVVNVGCVGERPTPGIANAALIESSPLGVFVDQLTIEL